MSSNPTIPNHYLSLLADELEVAGWADAPERLRSIFDELKALRATHTPHLDSFTIPGPVGPSVRRLVEELEALPGRTSDPLAGARKSVDAAIVMIDALVGTDTQADSLRVAVGTALDAVAIASIWPDVRDRLIAIADHFMIHANPSGHRPDVWEWVDGKDVW